MKSAKAVALAGSLVLVGLTACERAEDVNARKRTTAPSTTAPSTSTPDVRPGAGNLGTAMHDQAMTAWKRQISDMRGRVDMLKSKVDSYQGADKSQVQDQYIALQTQVAALDTRVRDFRDTSSTGFDTFRSDIETSMARVNNQCRDLEQKLSQVPSTIPPTSDTPKSPDIPSDVNPAVPPSNPD